MFLARGIAHCRDPIERYAASALSGPGVSVPLRMRPAARTPVLAADSEGIFQSKGVRKKAGIGEVAEEYAKHWQSELASF